MGSFYDGGPRSGDAFDTIEWDCGVDLDPEYIYAKCKEGSTAESLLTVAPPVPTALPSSEELKTDSTRQNGEEPFTYSPLPKDRLLFPFHKSRDSAR